jgi:hypothetical protein
VPGKGNKVKLLAFLGVGDVGREIGVLDGQLKSGEERTT